MRETPALDRFGYPTEETLKKIEDWPYENDKEASEVLDYALEAWWNKDILISKNPEAKAWYISTGGWSGNEELVDALQKSLAFDLYYLVADLGYGHYIVVHKDDEKLFNWATSAAIQIALGDTWCPNCYEENKGERAGKTIFEMRLCSNCSD